MYNLQPEDRLFTSAAIVAGRPSNSATVQRYAEGARKFTLPPLLLGRDAVVEDAFNCIIRYFKLASDVYSSDGLARRKIHSLCVSFFKRRDLDRSKIGISSWVTLD